MTRHYDNVNNTEKVKQICRKFHDILSDHLKNVFKNSNIILAQKQPKNLLPLYSKTRFNTDTNNFIQLSGLFKCADKRCKICSLHVIEDNSFVMSDNMGWEFCSHGTCSDIRAGISTCKSPIHVYHCVMKNK